MVESNVATMRRWFEEVWNQGRTQIVQEVVAPECAIHGVSETGEDLLGPGGFLEVHRRLKSAFPDMRLVVEDCWGAEDRVVVRWSGTMRHTGDGLGIAATGAALKLTGMTIVRFANGKAVESWDEWDKMGMFRQIEAARAKRAEA